MKPMESAVANFWTRVTPAGDDECWLWEGGSNHGYGIHAWHRTPWKAHRLAWTLLIGPIPDDGLVFDHLCRERRCVNPRHLERVTQQTNILRGDGSPAQNARKTHCSHDHPLSGDNLRIRKDGSRICRECRRRTARERDRRRRA